MNDHEISGTKFHNFHSSKFERSIQRVSIERFHLTYIYLTRPIHLVDGMALKKRKKKQILHLPLPQVAGSCLSHATSNYLVYTPVHSRTKARGKRIDRYSITRSRAVETRGGGRREFKPLWKSSQKLISPFSVQPFSSDPPTVVLFPPPTSRPIPHRLPLNVRLKQEGLQIYRRISHSNQSRIDTLISLSVSMRARADYRDENSFVNANVLFPISFFNFFSFFLFQFSLLEAII